MDILSSLDANSIKKHRSTDRGGNLLAKVGCYKLESIKFCHVERVWEGAVPLRPFAVGSGINPG